MSSWTLVLVSSVVFIGAFAQRITGMGFALVVSPFLVLLLGPFSGVLVVNIASVLSALIVLARVRREIEWRRFTWLVIPALVGIVPGSILANELAPGWLELLVGVLLLVALTASLAARRMSLHIDGGAIRSAAGFSSGLMNAAAGIGGPAVSIYGILSEWPQRPFAATLQPYFATIGLASLVTKLAIDPAGWPASPWWTWAVIAAFLVVGIGLGDRLSVRIHPSWARLAVIAIAYMGAAFALVHGLASLGAK